MFGPYLNFATTEAYKLLRTNLMFSFSDEGVGHVIGITSAVQAEGKSSTACNAAYALAEAGCRVLLLEADLRRPTVSSKLGIARTPGLTNLLVSRDDYRESIQKSPHAPKMDILASGDIPPNPSELLASNRMARLMEQLKAEYDYIVMDLPPVTAVSDALAVSKFLDGVVMAVRAGVSDQQMLAEALRQLEMVDVSILGFVYRDGDASRKKYGKQYKKKYYKYYNVYNKK
jgi:capsular exopolysaccharide synthesis family protein